MVQTYVNLVMKNEKDVRERNANIELENESLSSLTELYKPYMDNLRFHKENGTLNPEREKNLISKIDYVFEINEGRSGKKKYSHKDDDGRPQTSIDGKNYYLLIINPCT